MIIQFTEYNFEHQNQTNRNNMQYTNRSTTPTPVMSSRIPSIDEIQRSLSIDKDLSLNHSSHNSKNSLPSLVPLGSRPPTPTPLGSNHSTSMDDAPNPSAPSLDPNDKSSDRDAHSIPPSMSKSKNRREV